MLLRRWNPWAVEALVHALSSWEGLLHEAERMMKQQHEKKEGKCHEKREMEVTGLRLIDFVVRAGFLWRDRPTRVVHE